MNEKAAEASTTVPRLMMHRPHRAHGDQPPVERGHQQGQRIAGRRQQQRVDDEHRAHRIGEARQRRGGRNSRSSRSTGAPRRRGSCRRRTADRARPRQGIGRAGPLLRWTTDLALRGAPRPARVRCRWQSPPGSVRPGPSADIGGNRAMRLPLASRSPGSRLRPQGEAR